MGAWRRGKHPGGTWNAEGWNLSVFSGFNPPFNVVSILIFGFWSKGDGAQPAQGLGIDGAPGPFLLLGFGVGGILC